MIYWPASDLVLISEEVFLDSEGRDLCCAYSLDLKAFTCVGADERDELIRLGSASVKTIPAHFLEDAAGNGTVRWLCFDDTPGSLARLQDFIAIALSSGRGDFFPGRV